MDHIKDIAIRLNIKESQVQNTLSMLEEGSTVPFIARYRKERTGGLDEDQIRTIQEVYQYEVKLAKRKEDVLKIIATQGKLTDEITLQVNQCSKLSEVEDIYRPYQQKKKTRATTAIALGLEPLAKWMLALSGNDLNSEARKYLNAEVTDEQMAIAGAKDIIAEIVSNDADIRKRVRSSMGNYGIITTKVKKNNPDEDQVYQMYYDFKDKVKFIAPHRIMAIERAEKEKVIKVNISFDENYQIEFAKRKYSKRYINAVGEAINQAVEDGMKRLVFPSVENEIRSELVETAQEKSIDIFSMNLEKLLLQTPLKNKMILGLDPAFRTGCKIAVVDVNGKMLAIDVIYPHPPVNKKKEAEEILLNYFSKYPIDIVAIGNGTASRESEQFVADIIQAHKLNIQYTLVSEAGASVYSASELAKKEFPTLHVEQRSAVSIARRTQDPLAELIKIDPQSIGVGQYQHDLPTARLNERLDFVVSKVVNRVGVNVNTASVELLKHISGLTLATADSIVNHRNEQGSFNSRDELKKVKKLGAKSYEQAAGFLRIEDGNNKLDRTAIHPESYDLANKILQKAQVELDQLGTSACFDKISNLDCESLVKEFNSDSYTIGDILENLSQPLRDYRDNYQGPMLRSNILTIDDLQVGMELEGVVRNVVDFGAFVDIGLKNDALVHISKMSKDHIKHPSEVVQVGDICPVWVDSIDLARHKVQITLIEK